ncbi:unnamed protein product [Rotaria socialis]|uniref:Uncharacterized protein n=1 Tax=Rotaria socialis TaxID=392032 RepID=A0A820Y5K3_9BILA|nr:unnamed protein product [Rotaria socialis]CAF3172657.1 unnamed protein product [Rotaria socialis]CAF3350938.1 unnamed protein product [Rotaria socialis]CAF3444781.1 unnamed protein product [Rotaria socialis]CAF3795854.1 unnamed protein product [Rotaria socialis]
MEACIQSLPSTPYRSARSRSYQTTYQRQFSSLKRSLTIDEGVPSGQQFLIGCPYQLNDPVGVSSYTVDYPHQKDTQPESIIRPNTPRAHRPHPNPQFTHWPRRPVTVSSVVSEETKQALRNQLNSTYQTDYIGSPQGFPLPLAYNRSRPFWRNRGHHTLDSEYRSSYEQPLRTTSTVTTTLFPGRYRFSCRIPADAVVPLTLPMWRNKSSKSTYKREISEKAPSQLYMKDFVDSLSGPMDQ